jgi:hypothetical protein
LIDDGAGNELTSANFLDSGKSKEQQPSSSSVSLRRDFKRETFTAGRLIIWRRALSPPNVLVPLVSLEGLLTFWMLTRAESEPLKGRFKGEVDSRWHVVPISDQSQSNIPFRLWMEWIVYWRVKLEGREKGWLFESQPDARAKFGHYDPLFRSLIAKARDKNPRFFPAVVEGTDFSLWWSPRQGAVLETTNLGVDTKVIELVNNWRKKEAAKGSEPGLHMRQVYTQVQNNLPTMLEFSRAL